MLSQFDYDYLVVGAGLFGAVFANLASKAGRKCLVIDKRSHIGGNIYTHEVEGIPVHEYGAHIFHTSNEAVWKFVNQFSTFNNFVNSPVANYKGRLFNLPFNMNTFYAMWGVKTPAEAFAKIEAQRASAGIESPQNLEEQAISLVGTDIYETLIKGYTEKQWGRDCKDLPPSIIKRLPVRLTFDNNYFNARYQGIPEEGYTRLVAKLLEGSEVRLNTDFLLDKEYLSSLARKVIFTGPIDAFFENCFGPLEYRTVRFETEVLPTANYQGVAVVNYTEREVPSSISTSFSGHLAILKRLSSAVNIQKIGIRRRNPIIPSMMKKMHASMLNTQNLLSRARTRRRSFSVVDSEPIVTTIWTK